MMRKRGYLCLGMLRDSFFSWRTVGAYLIAFTVILNYVVPYVRYAKGTVINLFEPFIILYGEPMSVTFLLLGYLILMSRAPFITARTESVIIRMTRMQWSDGMVLFIFWQTFFYHGFIMLLTLLMAAPYGYIGNMWSRVFYSMVRFGSDSAANIVVPDISFIETWSVYRAAGHSFLLVVLYCFLLGLILFVGNLAVHQLTGSVIAAAIHFIGYALYRNAGIKSPYFSLLARAIPAKHGIIGIPGLVLISSYGIFIFLIVLIYTVEHVVILRCDLKSAVSERNE